MTSASANQSRLAAAVVLAHAIILVVHGLAHSRLHITLSRTGNAYVAGVIGIGPLAALALLWLGERRIGAAVLAASMAGALLFGLWNHFFIPGPDHIAHVAAGSWRLPFRVTAWLLAAAEAGGMISGFALLRAPAECAPGIRSGSVASPRAAGAGEGR